MVGTGDNFAVERTMISVIGSRDHNLYGLAIAVAGERK